MGRAKDAIRVTCYVGKLGLEWVGRQLSWPFVAAYSKLKFDPILKEYHPQISDYYYFLFDTDLPPPKIKWGRDNSYNPKKDFLNLRYFPKDRQLLHGEISISSHVSNLASLCEEEGHRYHFNTNEILSKRARRKRRKFEIPRERDSCEALVIEAYVEGIAKAAKIKVLDVLGFPEISEFYTQYATRSSRPPKKPTDLDIAFITQRLLESDDHYFRDIANSNHFEAMASLSPVWESLEENVEGVSVLLRGVPVFE